MTVQRFRTIEEMGRAPVRVPLEDGFERFLRQCARYWSIAPRVYPVGVFRFRTLAEAQAERDRVTAESLVHSRGGRQRFR